ncbi:MAG TPA: AmmeMemoRadiSam system protein B [Bacteroidales bacterium]|jgi:AmmeMemoRadiSam system protein B|nr:AmmeMemoRadiSam system protein B [Bacteroidales bacterium]
MKKQVRHREPAVAGRFYPADPRALKREVEGYFKKSIPRKPGEIRALIVPHAGYVFSGKIAASGFHQLPPDATYKRIFILASSHRSSFDGASLYLWGDYRMPFGNVTVDTGLSEQLLQEYPNLFTDDHNPHMGEHSIEVQLPFLHHQLKSDFSIVPIVLGTSNPDTCRAVADALKPYMTDENLFVISSDFSHYPDYDDANRVDAITKDAILTNQPEELLSILSANRRSEIPNLFTSLCGWSAVLTLIYMTTGNPIYQYEAIDYCNSGDEKRYGDLDEVVGYWAIALYSMSS